MLFSKYRPKCFRLRFQRSHQLPLNVVETYFEDIYLCNICGWFMVRAIISPLNIYRCQLNVTMRKETFSIGLDGYWDCMAN